MSCATSSCARTAPGRSTTSPAARATTSGTCARSSSPARNRGAPAGRGALKPPSSRPALAPRSTAVLATGRESSPGTSASAAQAPEMTTASTPGPWVARAGDDEAGDRALGALRRAEPRDAVDRSGARQIVARVGHRARLGAIDDVIGEAGQDRFGGGDHAIAERALALFVFAARSARPSNPRRPRGGTIHAPRRWSAA